MLGGEYKHLQCNGEVCHVIIAAVYILPITTSTFGPSILSFYSSIRTTYTDSEKAEPKRRLLFLQVPANICITMGDKFLADPFP